MNSISLRGVGKRYGYQWIVQNLNQSFDSSQVYGISGANGSGKSTVIKMMSGNLSPSEGSILYSCQEATVEAADIFKFVSLAAPYTDLIQEYTLKEMFDFHKSFKPVKAELDFSTFFSMLDMQKTGEKQINHFSSGMKQKIQLALALVSDTPFLLLDEPTSFLDSTAKQWFTDMLGKYKLDRCVVIASNDTYDLDHCAEIVKI
jgi:ABC-type multidrug transport system ATPase subunit